MDIENSINVDLKKLGDFVRLAMKKDETLDQFSERVKLSKSYLSRLMNGKQPNPRFSSLKKIADASDLININDLLQAAGYNTVPEAPDALVLPTGGSLGAMEEPLHCQVPEKPSLTALNIADSFFQENEWTFKEREEFDGSGNWVNSFRYWVVKKDREDKQNQRIIVPAFYTDTLAMNAIFEIVDIIHTLMNSKFPDSSNYYIVTNSKDIVQGLQILDNLKEIHIIFTNDNCTFDAEMCY